MSETALVNLEFGKNLKATQTHPSRINNEVISEKFLLFLELLCTKFWPFFYKFFAKRINKYTYIFKTKTENFASNCVLQVDLKRKIILKHDWKIQPSKPGTHSSNFKRLWLKFQKHRATLQSA